MAISGSPGEKPLEAGLRAARGVWNQVPTLIPLLAVLSYGLGRLMVDGFYGQLHTTAEAAGLGYASILEPAAVLIAVGTAAWTVFVAVSVDLLDLVKLLYKRWQIVVFVISSFAVGGGIVAALALVARLEDLVVVLAGLAVGAVRTLIRKPGTVRASGTSPSSQASADENVPATEQAPASVPETAEAAQQAIAGTEEMAAAEGEQTGTQGGRTAADARGRRPTWTERTLRVGPVILSAAFLVGLCVAAYHVGAYEGGRAADGKPVTLSYLGFTIPSISATLAHVEPLGASTALARLRTESCWLDLGVGPGGLLLYSPSDHDTLTIPPDQVVVSSLSGTCPK